MFSQRSGRLGGLLPLALIALLFGLLTVLARGRGAAAEASETVAVRVAPADWQRVSGLQPVHVIDYGSFVWLEVSPADLARLERSGVPFQQQGDTFALDLGGMRFDPRQGGPALPAGWEGATDNGPDLHLIQFAGPTQAAWLAGLKAAGLEVAQYIHPHSYVVWGTGETVAAAAGEGHVRWSGPFAPAYRVLQAWRNLPDEPARASVLLYRGADTAGALAALAALGGRMGDVDVLNETWAVADVTLSGASFRAAAAVPGVYSIQPLPSDGGLRGEMSNQINVGNYDAGNLAFPGYLAWLASTEVDGSGVIIANVDGGVQETHPDLINRFLPCTGQTCSATSSSHGTHTAGIMAADGSSGVVDGYGFLRGLGVAPGANLVEQVYSGWYNQPGGMLLLMTDSYNNGASLSGNSWGPSGSPLGYDNHTMQVDIGVRDADPNAAGSQPLTFVLSFMNGSGGYQTQGTPDEAKNIFNIGSTKMQNADGSQILDIDDLSSNTAHGPALDGRTIPHLVAPGCRVDSTLTTGHGLNCGTSMASPHTSGAVALFIEYFRGLPLALGNGSGDPSPAMVKAAFLPVAYDLAGHLDADGVVLGHPFDSKQGWGRMNVAAVVSPTVEAHYFDNPVIFDNSGEQWTQSLYVVDPTQPMKLMLVWTDAPGHGLGGSTPAWNNDLDLEVVYQGNTYRGNNFDSNGWSQSGGTADFRNNTEGVFLGPTAAGSVMVRVMASNINSDGVPHYGDGTDQDFALVCYNCTTLLEPSELLVHVQDSGSAPIAGAQVVATSGTMTETYSGSTNSLGNALLLVEANTYTVTAGAFGYLPAMTNATTISGTQTAVTLTLSSAPSFSVSGQVTDQATGAPLRWATVRLNGTPLAAETDANGQYSLTVPQGDYDMTASGRLHQDEVRAVSVAGNLTEVFALVATTTDGLLFGEVRSANTGLVMEGALVALQGGGSDTTDENGYYEIQQAPGTYTAEASAALYGSVQIPGVVIQQSNLTQQDIELPSASLAVTPDPVAAYVQPGGAITVPLRVSNDGDVALTFEIVERDGGFDPAARAVTILLVDDDDNSPNVRPYYTAALDALGYSYTVYDVPGANNGPSAATMAAYDLVIWFSGDKFGGGDSAGPNSYDEGQLATYLDGGGKLFLSSQDYHYDMGLTPFMQNYLGVASITDDDGDYSSVSGQNEFAGLGPYGLAYPGSDYSDRVTASTALVAYTGDNTYHGGVYNDNTVFLAFMWEGIQNGSAANGRESLEAAILYLVGGDIPWLTVTPISGTVPANSYLDVQLGFSAFPPTYTVPGTYTGTLRFDSNDPDNQELSVAALMAVVSETFQVDVSKAASLVEVEPGQTFTYTVQRQLSMAGPNSYAETLYDPLPAELTVLTASIRLDGVPMPGLYDAAAHAISGTLTGNFTDLHSYSLSYQVRVDEGVVSGTVLANTITYWLGVNNGPLTGPYAAGASVTVIVPPGPVIFTLYLPVALKP